MEQFLGNIKEWLFTFSLPTGNASFWEMTSAIGSLLVPLVIFWWATADQKRKDKRDKREKDKETILAYIEKELIPLTSGKYEFKEQIEENSKTEIKKLFEDYYSQLSYLKQIIDISSYSYMGEYINLLIGLTWYILAHHDLSKQDLLCFHKGISSNITSIFILLLQNKNQYKKIVLFEVTHFTSDEGKITDITLYFLKTHYPLYYDSTRNWLKKIEELQKKMEQEQKKVNTHMDTFHKTVVKEIVQLDKEIEETN